jgi:hypothetical protein
MTIFALYTKPIRVNQNLTMPKNENQVLPKGISDA